MSLFLKKIYFIYKKCNKNWKTSLLEPLLNIIYGYNRSSKTVYRIYIEKDDRGGNRLSYHNE